MREDDQGVIEQLESRLAPLDGVVRLLLPDGNANDETLEVRRLRIIETVERLSHQFFITPSGSVTPIGTIENAHIERTQKDEPPNE